VCASAQELEPGAYWPLPKGLNIVTVLNSLNWGDLAFDPAAPIDEASATINTTAFAFTKAFSLAGRSANAGVAVPVVAGHLEGQAIPPVGVVIIQMAGDEHLTLVVDAGGRLPSLFGLGQRRQQHRRQDRDNGDDHEQFDQGETGATTPGAGGT